MNVSGKFILIGAGLLVVLVCFPVSEAQAAYLRDVPVAFRQPDGTVLSCYVSGDEFFNWAHDRDGYPIMRDPSSGFYVYATVVDGVPVPTHLRVGEAVPARASLNKDFKMAPQRWEEMRQQFISKPRAFFPPERQLAPKTGVLQNIVIFIRFSDEAEFTTPISVYETSFNSDIPGVNSLRNYFQEVSYNRLLVQSYFYPLPGVNVVSFQDSHPRGYFMPIALDPLGYSDSAERDQREQTLIRDALLAVKAQIPGDLDLDGDDDGQVDNMVFIISGTPTAWNTLLWPHAWSLYMYTVYLNGAQVVPYNFQIQSFLSNGSTHVLAHEMLHSVGFPDLYHYASDGLSPVGAWDIMASPTAPPQHPGAYTKWRYGGWIDAIPEIAANGGYALNPLTSPLGNCYKILSPEDPGGAQFYVVEYRKKQTGTFDATVPGEGMLVYRIDRRNPGIQGSTAIPEEVYIYRPGGTLSTNGSLSTAHFSQGSGRNLINNGTDPVPWLADGTPGGLNLFNIGEAAETISFTAGLTAPQAPVLVAPADHALDAPLSVLLTWDASAGAESYDIQVSTDPDFNNLIMDKADNVLNFWPVNSLVRSTTYYWRVRGQNYQGEGVWSPYFQFTTLPDLPAAIRLSSPENGWVDVTLNPVLVWQNDQLATSYHLQLSLTSDFDPVVHNFTNLPATEQSVSGLNSGSTWYWRVAGHNGAGDGPWSDVWSFTTIQSPANAPVLSWPLDGALGETVNPALSWAGVNGASAYEVALDVSADFPAPVFHTSSATGAGVTASNLENMTTYFWHVRGLNEAGPGPWSSIRSFTTQELPVELVSFTATAHFQGIHLEWVTASETENYGFDVERKAANSGAGESAWSKINFVEGHHSTSVEHTYQYLDQDVTVGDYAYRLKQIDLDGHYAYLPEQQVSWAQPLQWKLDQNYPNPFNATTVITYQLQQPGPVQLAIINAMGQTVRSLVQNFAAAGEHVVRWDGCDDHGLPVAGGIYYYTLRCAEFQETRAMTLLK